MGKVRSLPLKVRSGTLNARWAWHIASSSALESDINKMVLNNVRQFLNLANEDENCQTSKMELVDENPDTDETMLEVAEDLLDKFTIETQQGWVILVGDGKTYEHLMNIKRHYGQALQKLLIFLGDRHTLQNFQPVLMKIYYSAGLKELAMASGYRGSTLSSLENCSNFKRTHCFLLQVWEALYHEMFEAYSKHMQSTASVMLDTTKCILSTAIQENLKPEELMKRVEGLMQDTNSQADFLECQSQADDTWKFGASLYSATGTVEFLLDTMR